MDASYQMSILPYVGFQKHIWKWLKKSWHEQNQHDMLCVGSVIWPFQYDGFNRLQLALP